jgi:hypothetical protein
MYVRYVLVQCVKVCISWNKINNRKNMNGVTIKNTGPKFCIETSVQNYHFALRNNPEECRSQYHRGRSTESRIKFIPLKELLLQALPNY